MDYKRMATGLVGLVCLLTLEGVDYRTDMLKMLKNIWIWVCMVKL